MHREIAGFAALVAELRETIATILSQCEQLRTQTIEALIGRSDADLAADVLSGRLPFPAAPQAKVKRGKA